VRERGQKNQRAIENRPAVSRLDDVSRLCGHGMSGRKLGRRPGLATARLGLAVHFVVASSDAAPRLRPREGDTQRSPTMLMMAESFT
jgi:hypothetical protein